MRNLIVLSLGLLSCSLAMSRPASAVENGLSIYPKGMADFMSGALPPVPGFYLTNMFYYFNGSADAIVRNGVAELGVNLDMRADFVRGTYVTDWSVLGGTYAAAGVLAVAGADLDANATGPLGGQISVHRSNSDLGDSMITPVLLGWHDGSLYWNAGLSIYIPTGGYASGQLNIGRNVWGFMPQFAMTWFDPASGWDISGTLVYVSMTENGATNYQSGDILHFDWAVGKHLAGGWEVGIAGNLLQQVSADSGAGALLGPFQADSFGLGPAVTYSGKLGELPLVLNAKWERDVAFHRTLGGDVVAVTATLGL